MDPRYDPRASRRAGSRHGRTRACTRPARARAATRRSSSAPAAERHRLAAPSATRSSSRSRTRSSAGTGCAASTRSSSRATTTRGSRRRTSSRRQLATEGKSQRELGREAFVDARLGLARAATAARSWSQFRRLGASLDYRRERFTMDDGYVRAVMRCSSTSTAGLDLPRQPHRQLVPVHDRTALSDLEVEHEEMDDTLSYVRYPLADGSGTSRSRPCGRRRSSPTSRWPCTRTTSATATLVGKEVVVPFVERRGAGRSPTSGSSPSSAPGALKVTPGHDPMDFEIGRDHGLPELTVIGLDGRMNEDAGELAGLTQEEAGERVLAWAEERDLLEKREPYRHAVATCERCHTRIEPLISLQWWCAMEELQQPALAALRRSGASASTPESQHRFAIDSLENVRPTGTSRGSSGGATSCRSGTAPTGTSPSRRTRRTRAPSAARASSAATTTCSTRGSRRRSGRSRRSAGPTTRPSSSATTRATVNTTARDIIRLWENRMIFAGLELLGDVPFDDVSSTRRVLAPTAGGCRRASAPASTRSTLIEPYGADATRYGLLKIVLDAGRRASRTARSRRAASSRSSSGTSRG